MARSQKIPHPCAVSTELAQHQTLLFPSEVTKERGNQAYDKRRGGRGTPRNAALWT